MSPSETSHKKLITPPNFNMEPENHGFQKDFPFPGTYFQVPCEISGVYMKPTQTMFFERKKHPQNWCIDKNPTKIE